MTRKFVILTLLGVLTVSLSACANTFSGAGKDMENIGRTMQDTFN